MPAEDAATPLLTDASKSEAKTVSAPVTFEWSKRACTGHRIHQACLDEDFETAKAALDEEPGCVNARFTYETVFNGVAQEGSGEAIHIAVSRTNLNVVTLLLERGASLSAMVSRDHKPHYDVLHSAVFSEGRGGDQGVVKLLLERKAVMTRNLDKKLPLHIAFQTGNSNVIRLLPQEDVEDVPGLDSPLEVGIKMGKMSDEQLAVCAPPTPKSLQLFIHLAPTCVPPFLERIQAIGELSAAKLAECLTVPDIVLVLKDSPAAAAALLDSVSDVPECQSNGWHGLPTRVSFAPRSRKERFWMSVNPDPNQLSFYEPDNMYLHDDARFTYPAWHDELLIKDLPISDVDVKVLHVPNIICPTFFSALIRSAKDDSLFIFENNAVRGIIDYTWWKGANDVDLLSIIFNIYGLACLILETYLVFERQQGKDRSETHPDGHTRRTEMPVSGDFIGSCGVVELLHELAEFIGAVSVGQGLAFFNGDRIGSILIGAVKLTLWFDTSHRLVRVLAIFICWTSLANVFTATEHIATILIPLTRVVRGLVPAGAVTLIGFCSVTHMFYALQTSAARIWPDVFFMSFATLFTARLPEDTAEGWLPLTINYGAVFVFTIFFLNIFIGVISEQYSLETERAPLQLQKRRATRCLAFMYRVKCVPCGLMSTRVAFIVTAVSTFIMTAWLVVCFVLGKLLPGAAVVIIVCQMLMIIAAYQNPQMPWAKREVAHTSAQEASTSSEGHYLWLAVKRQADEGNAEEMGGAGQEDIRSVVKEELEKILGITAPEEEPEEKEPPPVLRWRTSQW